MIKKTCIFIAVMVVTSLVAPYLVHAQATQTRDMIDIILQQYKQFSEQHSQSVQSARDAVGSSEEEQLRILLEQIQGAEQVVQQQQSSGIAIAINPPSPEPYQEITASLSGYGLRKNEARISWFVDGKLVTSGTGATSIKTSLGAAGQPVAISVAVDPLETASFTRSTIVVPNIVDMLWEAVDAHTPPFYRGKALPSYDSIVKITAIPTVFDASGVRVQANDLVYNWSLNGRDRDLSQYSGYGSNTAYAFASFLNKGNIVTAELSNSARGVDVRRATFFVLHDPEIVFYRKDPLRGVNYERAVTSSVSIGQGDSIRLVAEPYSFDMRNGFADLDLNWRINGNVVRAAESMNRGEIPLTSQSSGRTRLDLEISTNKILQKAASEIDIFVE